MSEKLSFGVPWQKSHPGLPSVLVVFVVARPTLLSPSLAPAGSSVMSCVSCFFLSNPFGSSSSLSQDSGSSSSFLAPAQARGARVQLRVLSPLGRGARLYGQGMDRPSQFFGQRRVDQPMPL